MAELLMVELLMAEMLIVMCTLFPQFCVAINSILSFRFISLLCFVCTFIFSHFNAHIRILKLHRHLIVVFGLVAYEWGVLKFRWLLIVVFGLVAYGWRILKFCRHLIVVFGLVAYGWPRRVDEEDTWDMLKEEANNVDNLTVEDRGRGRRTTTMGDRQR